MSRITKFALVVLASSFMPGTLALADDELPDIIVPDVMPLGFIPRPPPTVIGNFVPEGIEYLDGTFILGNIPSGEIFLVRPDGKARVLVPAMSDLLQQSVFGIDLDRERRLLHIASAKFPTDPGAQVQSSYLAVRVDDGEIVRSVDLSNVAPAFDRPRRTNDLCFLETGSNPVPVAHRSKKSRGRLNPGKDGAYDVFVTDSNSAQIWKIDQHDQVTTFATDPRFNANPVDPTNPLQIGLNGIVCHPDGFLLTGRFGNAANSNIFKVDMEGHVSEVAITDPDGVFAGADGLFLDGPDTMFVVVFNAAGVSGVAVLETDDAWTSAAVTRSTLVPFPTGAPPSPVADGDREGCVRATTGVIAEGDFFVSCSFTSSINKVKFPESRHHRDDDDDDDDRGHDGKRHGKKR